MGGKITMRNTHQLHLPILIALFSITMGAYGQTEKFIGKGNVQAIQFSPDGKWLAIGTTALLELYETKTYQLVHQLETPVEVMDFRPDGVEIAVAAKRVPRRFEVTTGRELGTLE